MGGGRRSERGRARARGARQTRERIRSWGARSRGRGRAPPSRPQLRGGSGSVRFRLSLRSAPAPAPAGKKKRPGAPERKRRATEEQGRGRARAVCAARACAHLPPLLRARVLCCVCVTARACVRACACVCVRVCTSVCGRTARVHAPVKVRACHVRVRARACAPAAPNVAARARCGASEARQRLPPPRAPPGLRETDGRRAPETVGWPRGHARGGAAGPKTGCRGGAVGPLASKWDHRRDGTRIFEGSATTFIFFFFALRMCLTVLSARAR